MGCHGRVVKGTETENKRSKVVGSILEHAGNFSSLIAAEINKVLSVRVIIFCNDSDKNDYL